MIFNDSSGKKKTTGFDNLIGFFYLTISGNSEELQSASNEYSDEKSTQNSL